MVLLTLPEYDFNVYNKFMAQPQETQAKIGNQKRFEKTYIYCCFNRLKIFKEIDPEEKLEQYEAEIKYEFFADKFGLKT